MNQPVVVASGITHSFGSGANRSTVLHDINLEIHAGEVLMLMGPSGSGKTTLLNIIGCLLQPTEGTVRLHGQPVHQLTIEKLAALRLQHFGFVFQSHNLFPVLTATENVMVALDLLGVKRSSAQERARELLAHVGLGHRLDNYPAQLSIGQKQRVAIARALAADPPILMADEPTASLDSETGLKAIEFFRMLAHHQHRAVVIVTHDPRIFHFADRVVHIEDGRIGKHEIVTHEPASLTMGDA